MIVRCFHFPLRGMLLALQGLSHLQTAHWFVNGASTGQTGGESFRTFSKYCLLVSKWRGQS